jgi:hypothetical protein
MDEGRTGRLEFGDRRAMSWGSWESFRGRSEPKQSAEFRRGQGHCARCDASMQSIDGRWQRIVSVQALPPRQRLT